MMPVTGIYITLCIWMMQKERQASTTPSGKPACFGSALWPSQLTSSSAAQPKKKQGTSITAPQSASPLAALLGKAESSQGRAKQTGLAALVEGKALVNLRCLCMPSGSHHSLFKALWSQQAYL